MDEEHIDLDAESARLLEELAKKAEMSLEGEAMKLLTDFCAEAASRP